ncbi:hypothetical protein [Streptomyces sp. NBC_00989]|uniref:hypothetical protein n=1 Tax=Streptomyces sp. NBC_00989 TaxID=2903705 RepID=UPI00386CEAEC|nr:hypothetical protein OG714_04450 [Streptomyces sp. NBC_00989]
MNSDISESRDEGPLRIGVRVPPCDRADRVARTVRRAEELGFDQVWFPDSHTAGDLAPPMRAEVPLLATVVACGPEEAGPLGGIGAGRLRPVDPEGPGQYGLLVVRAQPPTGRRQFAPEYLGQRRRRIELSGTDRFAGERPARPGTTRPCAGSERHRRREPNRYAVLDRGDVE